MKQPNPMAGSTAASRTQGAAMASQLKALAHARGETLFAQLSTLEHEVAACILAGDSYAQAARYVGVSPSTVRRTVQRIVARLSEVAPVGTPRS